MRDVTCCFTGHRIIPGQYVNAVREALIYEITRLIEKGYTDFIAGGALGFDTMAAQAVLLLRTRYPQIRLLLALPCREQDAKWDERDRAVYRDILRRANGVAYISEEYTKGCMLKRNRFLVDRSSACIAFMTKKSGGTAYTVRYAYEKGLDMINIADGCG